MKKNKNILYSQEIKEEDLSIFHNARNLMQKYDKISHEDYDTRFNILKELFKEIGKGTIVESPFRCDFGKFITIGKSCFINFNCVFLDWESIKIGDNCLFGPGVHIYTATHPIKTIERIVPNENKELTQVTYGEPVNIGDKSWIGGNSTILPGVNIGKNTVIGGGSVVTKNIPSNVLAYGNPCKIIRKIPD